MLSAISSQSKNLVETLCLEFEYELKQVFRDCKGLSLPGNPYTKYIAQDSPLTAHSKSPKYNGKIIYSEIVQSPQFYLDEQGFFAEATSFVLNGENLYYLLGMLNSKLISFAFKNFYAGGGLREKDYRYKKAFLERLPIPKLKRAQEEEFVQIIKEILESKKTEKDTQELESHLDSMIFDLYGLSELERQLVNTPPRNLIVLLLLSAVGSRAKDLVQILYPAYKNELQNALYSAKNLDSKPIHGAYQGKIVWNRISSELCFSYDNMGHMILDSMFMITCEDERVSKYLLGTLNSSIAKHWIKNNAATLGDGTYGAKIYIERFPIPKLDSMNHSITEQIITLVNQILESKAKDPTSNITKPESEIDSLVYQLYNLSDSDISLLNQE